VAGLSLATHIMTTVDILLHLAPALVLLFLGWIFVRRRLNRELPLFFAYMLYVLLATGGRISVIHRSSPFFWVFWSTEAGFGVFALLVMREVFHRVFALAYASGLKPWAVLYSRFAAKSDNPGRDELPLVRDSRFDPVGDSDQQAAVASLWRALF
jgi:hypothetical protein